MILKKNKLTYAFWALYLIIFMATLLVSAYGIAGVYFDTEDVMVIGIVGGAVAIIGLILTYVSKGLDFSKPGSTFMEMSHFSEVVLITIITLSAFMIRFIYLTIIGGNTGHPPIDYLAILSSPSVKDNPVAYYFGNMMYYIELWFGDSMLLEAYTEAFLEFAISVMVYVSIRLLMGKTPGFIAASIYGILPYNIVRLTDTGYDTFISAIFCLAFTFIVITAYMYAYNKLSGAKAYILPILAGGLSGFCAYIDKSGLILLFFAIECFLVNKPVASEKEKNSVKLSAIIISICTAFVVCFIVGLFIINYDLKIPSDKLISAYIDGFGNIRPNLLMTAPAPGDISATLLICLSFIWILRIFSIERDHGSYFVMIPFWIMVLSLLGIGQDRYDMLTTVIWCMLAGMGFASIGSNNLDQAKRYKEERARAREEERRKAMEEHLEFLEKEKEELRLKAQINEEAKKRDKEKVIALLNEKPNGKGNNSDSDNGEKKNHKNMFGKKKNIVFKEEKESEISLEELEAELDFLHMGVEKENEEESVDKLSEEYSAAFESSVNEAENDSNNEAKEKVAEKEESVDVGKVIESAEMPVANEKNATSIPGKFTGVGSGNTNGNSNLTEFKGVGVTGPVNGTVTNNNVNRFNGVGIVGAAGNQTASIGIHAGIGGTEKKQEEKKSGPVSIVNRSNEKKLTAEFTPASEKSIFDEAPAKVEDEKVETVSEETKAAEVVTEQAAETVTETVVENKTETAAESAVTENTEALTETVQTAETEKAPEKEPEKEPELSENGQPIVRMNPGVRFGRRMDYRTAVVKPSEGIHLSVDASLKDTVAHLDKKEEPAQETPAETNVAEETVAAEETQAVEENTQAGETTAPEVTETILETSVSEEKSSEIKPVEEKSIFDEPAKEEKAEVKEEPKSIFDETPAQEKKEESSIFTDKSESNLIKNPLPTPKKHIAKQLEFDLDIPESSLHFDLLDLEGKDFFDIN